MRHGASLVMAGLATAILAGAASLFPGPAQAQQTIRPYSYGIGGSGASVGMSRAYRQAYLFVERIGDRPDALRRDGAGNLSLVERGPDGLAIPIPFASPAPPVAGTSVLAWPCRRETSPIDAWIAQLDGIGQPGGQLGGQPGG